MNSNSPESNFPPEPLKVIVRGWIEKQRLINNLFKQKFDEIIRRLEKLEEEARE